MSIMYLPEISSYTIFSYIEIQTYRCFDNNAMFFSLCDMFARHVIDSSKIVLFDISLTFVIYWCIIVSFEYVLLTCILYIISGVAELFGTKRPSSSIIVDNCRGRDKMIATHLFLCWRGVEGARVAGEL